MSSQLPSEKMIVAVPLSFTGSAQRIWRITRTGNLVANLLLIPLALILIMGAWIFVACWYFIMYILFGVFFILYRFLRHSSRQNKRDKLRHREVLNGIEQRNQS